jgi:hypothetical protein
MKSLLMDFDVRRLWMVPNFLILRAGDRDRTGDVQLGKLNSN